VKGDWDHLIYSAAVKLVEFTENGANGEENSSYAFVTSQAET